MTDLSSRGCGVGVWIIAIVLGLSAAPVSAGQGTTASILGQVKDESGASLPGVTVTLRSPALQTPERTVVTDGRGEYQVPQLPIGVYSLDYELAGFQTARVADVRLTVGFVAKLDQVMKLGNLAETITVSGAAPIVDVVSSGTRTELTRENVELIPTSRDGITSYLGQVPGARPKFDVGGAAFADTTETSAIGIAGHEWMLIEGVFANSVTPGAGANSAHFDFNSIEGTRIQMVGNSAEMPRPGMLIEMTSKAGGNQYHGDAELIGTGDKFQGTNVDDRLRSLGVRGRDAINKRYDVSGDLGGRFIQDKLWFFVAGRRRYTNTENLGGPQLGVRQQAQEFLTQKYSYQIRPQDKLIGVVDGTWGQDYHRGATLFVPLKSTDNQVSYYTTSKLEWQATRGTNTAFSVQFGRWVGTGTWSGNDPGEPLTMDLRTQMVTGNNRNAQRFQTKDNIHSRGWITRQVSGARGGNHQLKAGFDYLNSLQKPGFLDRGADGNYQLIFDGGVATQISTYNDPVVFLDKTNYVGIYGQDQWSVARRLTLNLGVRYANDRAFIPAQCRDAGTFAAAECFDKVSLHTWNSVVPRVHAAYDVSGNGRAVIKGGWGRFAAIRESGGNEIVQLNPNAQLTTLYRWRDLNGNRNYDPGEVNLSLDGPDFLSFTTPSHGVVNPEDKPRTFDELSAGYDQQIGGQFALQFAGVYSRETNTQRVQNIAIPYSAYSIPITNRDPGPDGVVGNADDGGLVSYLEYPAAFRPGSVQTFKYFNDPNNPITFKTFQVTGLKRMSQNWQFLASYSVTKRHIPFADELAFNPNAEINTSDNTWEYTGKISGSYLLPFGITGSANYQLRSGDPLAREVLFRGGSTIPSLAVKVEPLGSFKTPDVHLVDFRVGKRFNLGGSQRIELQANIYNAFNTNVARALTVRSGPNYLVPTSIVLPRVAEFGASFKF